MRRIYRLLLRLYPSDLRAAFAAEMAEVFERAAEERRSRGAFAYLRFALVECAGLISDVVFEWMARSTFGARRSAGGSEPELCSTAPVLPADVLEAQRLVNVSVARMVEAIAARQFDKARFYSLVEQKASEELRRLRRQHGITG